MIYVSRSNNASSSLSGASPEASTPFFTRSAYRVSSTDSKVIISSSGRPSWYRFASAAEAKHLALYTTVQRKSSVVYTPLVTLSDSNTLRHCVWEEEEDEDEEGGRRKGKGVVYYV